MLTARHEAELESVRVRAEGEVAKQTAKAEGATELARAHAAEVGRLAAHVDELRSELEHARSR